MPYAYVVPKEVCNAYGQDFRSHPIGTGPFKFHTWSEGNTLILHRNEHYWKKDGEGVQLPYLDAVQVYFIPDKSQAFRAFQVGDLDFVSGIDEGSIDDLLYSNGSFKQSTLDQMNVVKCPYMNTEYIGVQLDPAAAVYEGEDHALLNVDFRKALNYAVDRDRLVTNLRNGLGIPGHQGIVPPAVPNFDQSKVEGYEFNKSKAKAALKASGLNPNDMPELELYVAKEHKRIGEYVVKSWEEVLGVKAKILNNAP
jgi:peptide/nickel transport system substrate-binding protein